MAVISDNIVEDIKSRIELSELIASYGIQVRNKGATKTACCPFHNEKTPSFSINDRKGFYHCFGCSESGDAIKFVQKMDGLSFVDAVKKLAQSVGITIEEKQDPASGKRKRLYALMAEAAAFYNRCLKQLKVASQAREYLKSRDLEGIVDDWLVGYAPAGAAVMFQWAQKHGFTPQELEEAGIVKCPQGPGDKGYHRFSGRLMFTIRDRQGRVVAFSGRQIVPDKRSGKYVNSPETPIFKKSNVLFAFERASSRIARMPEREGIICEGQVDVIRLHSAGFTNAVASQGTAFTLEHAQMLRKVADSMLIMYDDDEAGHKAAVKVARLLLELELPVRTVTLPGGEDPDSFIRKYGAGEMQKLLDAAESIVSFQLRNERAKERNPNSIDAVTRVSKSILQTIACAKSPVLRANLVNEASKLMSLPVAALNEELSILRNADGAKRVELKEAEAPLEEEVEVENVAPLETVIKENTLVISPSNREMAFMRFLMENEYDKEIGCLLGEYLPSTVFENNFTRNFYEAWKDQCETGEDKVLVFCSSLDEANRKLFETIILSQSKTLASQLSKIEILKDFVRALWADCLVRKRGELPSVSSNDALRMSMSMDIKRLSVVEWENLTDIISKYR